MIGWLKFYREMLGHAVWSLPPGQRCVWLTALALANVKPAEWYDGRERVQIAAGSFVTSQDHLAKRAGVGRQVVRDALKNLERIGSILTKTKTKRWTLIEIVNWPLYQAGDGRENLDANQPGTYGEPTGNHNLRMRERKKEEGSASRPTRSRGNGKVPAGYQEATDWWFHEFERTRGARPQFDQAEGACLKLLLTAHPLAQVKGVMTHTLTRTRLRYIREGHRYSIKTIAGSWNELWDELRQRAGEEGEPLP